MSSLDSNLAEAQSIGRTGRCKMNFAG